MARTGSREDTPLIAHSKNRTRRLLAGAALLFLLSGAVGAQEPTSLVGRRAPVFSLDDLHHGHVDLAAYRGKVVLLNFWATWCGPCKVEMPRFMAWQKQYGAQGLQVIGVSIDDSAAPARAFVDKLHVNYPVVMGSAKLGERYGGVLGVPVTFLIDRAGIVRARYDGEEHLAAEERQLQGMLKTR
ncbi:MAG: TlpA family protein disulfide reductase [Acidobacteriota bacterium]